MPRRVFLPGLVLAGLILGFAVYQTRIQGRELEALMQASGEAMAAALGHAVEDAIDSGRRVDELATRRLADQARLLGALYEAGGLDATALEGLVVELGLRHAIFFDARGRSHLAAAVPSCEPSHSVVEAYAASVTKLPGPPGRHAVLEPTAVMPAEDRLVVAVRRPTGGTVVVVADASDVQAFQRRIGADHLLSMVSGTDGVLFAVLEDRDGTSLGGVLPNGSLGEYREFLRAVVVGGETTRLRLGVSTAALAAMQRTGRIRNILLGLLLGGLAVAIAVGVLLRQRAEILRDQTVRARATADAVLTGMVDAVVLLDTDRVVRLVNDVASRLFGCATEELHGLPCAETPCWPLGQLVDAGHGVRELLLERPSDAPIPVLASVSPIRLPSAVEPLVDVGTVVVLRDLRPIRELEESSRRAENLSALGRLAASVAHEVRNPLNAIGVGVQRLEREFAPPERALDHRRLTRLLRDEVARLDRIVDRFLDFARNPQLEPRAGMLDELICDVLPLLERGLPPEVRVVVELEEGTAAVYDPTAMRQVLLNLVRNASEAVGTEGTIRIVARSYASGAVLEVIDDGPGIAADEQDRLFEYGYTTKPEGTGMGLPIVLRLVREMRGQVNVESSEGRGTTLRLKLPVTMPPGATPERAGEGHARLSSPAR